MPFSTEAALMGVAVALYLHDTVLMLSGNEAVLSRGWGGRWHAGFGAHRWRLNGKEPCLPNPFLPHRALFRLTWHWTGQPIAREALQIVEPPGGLACLAGPVYLTAFGLFVLLPIGLFSRWGWPVTAAAIVTVYAAIVANLSMLFVLRHRLQLPPGVFARIAFECLACPPFAINLVRKVCAARGVDEDFTAAARRLLPPEELAMANDECLLRIDEQIDFEPDDSVRMASLQQGRARFAPTPGETV